MFSWNVWKPKFLHAAYAQLAATGALFSNFLSGDQWVLITQSVIVVFSAASVAENRLMRGAPPGGPGAGPGGEPAVNP
jgi:hypothetical protein